MMFAGLDLARRIEAAEALIGGACADGASVLQVAGGTAIFVGPGSPLTRAVGIGMRGPVSADEMDRLEDFYHARDSAVTVDLCPLADNSIVELLGDRGYRLAEFNNVLVRPLAGGEIAAGETPVRLANEDEEQLWARTVGRGFMEKEELTREEMDIGLAIWRMPGSLRWMAFSGGEAGAAGAMAFDRGLATLFADSTLLGFRGMGLHAALIRARLRAAAEAGCDLATASTLPDSTSQRNYQRHGFQVAYTKATLVG
jgi:GNAT superfamily N-acetyltransferase